MYGLCDAVPGDEPCVQCRLVKSALGCACVPGPGADPPTHRKLFLRNTDDGWPRSSCDRGSSLKPPAVID